MASTRRKIVSDSGAGLDGDRWISIFSFIYYLYVYMLKYSFLITKTPI